MIGHVVATGRLSVSSSTPFRSVYWEVESLLIVTETSCLLRHRRKGGNCGSSLAGGVGDATWGSRPSPPIQPSKAREKNEVLTAAVDRAQGEGVFCHEGDQLVSLAVVLPRKGPMVTNGKCRVFLDEATPSVCSLESYPQVCLHVLPNPLRFLGVGQCWGGIGPGLDTFTE